MFTLQKKKQVHLFFPSTHFSMKFQKSIYICIQIYIHTHTHIISEFFSTEINSIFHDFFFFLVSMQITITWGLGYPIIHVVKFTKVHLIPVSVKLGVCYFDVMCVCVGFYCCFLRFCLFVVTVLQDEVSSCHKGKQDYVYFSTLVCPIDILTCLLFDIPYCWTQQTQHSSSFLLKYNYTFKS